MTASTGDGAAPDGAASGDRAARRSRPLDRVVALTDATVAIALTVLVLPLVDDAAHLGPDVTLGGFVRENGESLLALGVTFVVMCSMWLMHREVVGDVARESPPVVWATFVWLGAMVLLPLWSQLLWTGTDGDRGVFAVYIGTILVATAAVGVVRTVLVRHPEDARGQGPTDLVGTVVVLGLLILALVIAVTVPAVGMFALLLLVLGTPITAAVRRRRARGMPAR